MRTVVRIAAFAACAAVLCPPASAVNPARLALMPLPRQALGPDAAGLSLASDSGADSNATAARHAGRGLTASDLAQDGRIAGYTLDYAVAGVGAIQAARSLLEVQTIAELYRDRSTARQGLAFWQHVTGRLRGAKANGVTIHLAQFDADVADGAFAYELTYRRAGIPLVYVGDVVFRTGDLLGAVFVTATREEGLRGRSLALAARLAERIRKVLSGTITKP